MELSVLERFVIGTLLPREGSLLDLKAAENIRMATGFSEEDLAKLDIKEVTQGDKKMTQWSPEGVEAIGLLKLEFTGPQTKLLVDALQKLNSDKKLTADHLSLCEKFGIGKIE